MISVVIILPAARQADGNALSVAMGYDVAPGNTYSVGLSESGQGPATHYGCHVRPSESFVALLQAAKAGAAQPQPGIDHAWLQGLVDDMLISIDETEDAVSHFDSFAATHGLQRVAAP